MRARSIKGRADASWDRLARAALDCRDSLRGLLGRIDHAGKNPEEAANTLIEARAVIADAADRLRLGLKHPE